MRAIEYARTGSADVLHLVERDARPPAAGEVNVRIAISGVNPTDWKSRQGAGDGAELPVPQVPNQDGAGTIDAIGPGVTGFAVGDRVWVWTAAYQRPDGTAQEVTTLPLERVVALPDGVSFDVGASIGVPALTAHRALTAREEGPARLAPGALTGTVVLVAGGAGAVGHAAIQLAVWAGATVVTTVSSDAKAELAKAAGAQHIINYRTEDVATRMRELAPGGADIIVEVNALANLELDLEVLGSHGTISIYAASGDDRADIPLRAAMSKSARLQFLLLYVASERQKADAVASVSDALRDGVLEVGAEHGLPILRFPLDRTADAHRAVEQDAIGKVLIDVAS
ncbi:MAG TPA: NADPH:quinone reductase [Galbitalea sp.]|jgi:NADPH2:quinone reductase|nr:NADPH:quinone reductase [Galbitalea sp.]